MHRSYHWCHTVGTMIITLKQAEIKSGCSRMCLHPMLLTLVDSTPPISNISRPKWRAIRAHLVDTSLLRTPITGELVDTLPRRTPLC
jgi:hypothetical protein